MFDSSLHYALSSQLGRVRSFSLTPLLLMQEGLLVARWRVAPEKLALFRELCYEDAQSSMIVLPSS